MEAQKKNDEFLQWGLDKTSTTLILTNIFSASAILAGHRVNRVARKIRAIPRLTKAFALPIMACCVTALGDTPTQAAEPQLPKHYTIPWKRSVERPTLVKASLATVQFPVAVGQAKASVASASLAFPKGIGASPSPLASAELRWPQSPQEAMLSPGEIETASLSFPSAVGDMSADLDLATLAWPRLIDDASPVALSLASVPAMGKSLHIVTSPDGVTLNGDNPGSRPLDVQVAGPSHFAIDFHGGGPDRDLNYFHFRLEGAAGKDLTIDLCNVDLWKWQSLNPLYAYGRSFDDPSLYETREIDNPAEPTMARNGPLLPDTSGQAWHYIADVHSPHQGTLRLRQVFEQDAVLVAMKAPYLVDLNQRLLEQAAKHADATLVPVGKSGDGRPLTVLLISAANGSPDQHQRPTVLIYAREHGNEQDSSWAAWGAIQALLNDTAEAKRLREQVVFLIVPMLDPDGAIEGRYEHITHTFVASDEVTPEATQYVDFIYKWLDDGNRLDLILNLHNVESFELPHAASLAAESQADRAALSLAFANDYLEPRLVESGYQVKERSRLQGGTARFRFGGFLAFFRGPLHLPFELNSQAAEQHLTCQETSDLGRLFVSAAAAFLEGDRAASVLASTQHARAATATRHDSFDDELQLDPLRLEWVVWRRFLRNAEAQANSE